MKYNNKIKIESEGNPFSHMEVVLKNQKETSLSLIHP
jgi:hypothetical protein